MRRLVEGIDRGQATLLPECLVWRNEALLRLNYPCATKIAKLTRATVEPATTIMRKTLCVHIVDSPTIWFLAQSIKGTARPPCNVKTAIYLID